jgi:hypothetical protein
VSSTQAIAVPSPGAPHLPAKTHVLAAGIAVGCCHQALRRRSAPSASSWMTSLAVVTAVTPSTESPA